MRKQRGRNPTRKKNKREEKEENIEGGRESERGRKAYLHSC